MPAWAAASWMVPTGMTAGRAVAIGASFAGRGLAFGVGLGASSALGSSINPLTREVQYFANSIGSTMVPEISLIVQLYHAGKIGIESVRQMLAWQGATFKNPSPDMSVIDQAWFHAVELARPIWGLEDYRRWARFNRIDPAIVRDRLAREGHTKPLEQDLFMNDWIPLDDGVILQLVTRGDLTEDQGKAWLKTIGHTRTIEQNLLLGIKQPPAPGEIIALLNRDDIDPAIAHKWLKWYGFKDQTVRDKMLGLRNLIPSPSELIQFAVKEGWDDTVALRFGYDLEFPAPFQTHMERQGLGWSPPPITVGGVTYPGHSWPKMWWRSHWRPVSPSQAYDFLHRFRGNPLIAATWRVQGVTPFTPDDVDLVLKVNDYPPAFRKWLREASYRIFTRVDVRRLLQSGTINEEEATRIYEDQGYRRTDAERLSAFSLGLKRTAELNKLLSGHRARIISSYRSGMLDRDFAAVELFSLKYQSADDYNTFKAQPEQSQIDQATADPVAALYLDSVDAAELYRIAKVAIKAIHSRYLRWEIDDTEASTRLTGLGVQQFRVLLMIQAWEWERWGAGKTASASTLLQWVRRGAILTPVAIVRLIRMGYTQQDAYTMVGLAMQDYELAQARAEEAAAKTLSQEQSALASKIKALDRMKREAQAAMAKHGSASQLGKWLKAGLLDEAEYRYRMRSMGHTDEDIERSIESVLPGEGGIDDASEESAAFAAGHGSKDPGPHRLP